MGGIKAILIIAKLPTTQIDLSMQNTINDMKKALLIIILSCICILGCTDSSNIKTPFFSSIIYDKSDIEKFDSRNYGVDIEVKYKSITDKSTILIDVLSISSASKATVFRIILEVSEKLKDNTLDKVIFSHKGIEKFYITGAYFKTLGEEYGTQNAIYTMRTFPENVRNLDGTSAFETWSGGMIGVLNAQMKDLSDFHDRWYLE